MVGGCIAERLLHMQGCIQKNGMNNTIVQKKKIYGLCNKNFIHGLKSR